MTNSPLDKKRRQWARRIKSMYAVEVEDIARLLVAQDFRCPICTMPLTCGGAQAISGHEFDDNWSIDHDHRTGKVRGVLCQPCNWGALAWVEKIGPEQLQRVVAYLNKSLL